MKLRSQFQDRTAQRRLDLVQVRAALISMVRRVPLPPGEKSPPLDLVEKADRLALLRIADEVGPIFKGHAWGGFWIYVVGLQRCRHILRTHQGDLHPVTIDVTALFDKGILRQMEGEVHRRYRAALLHALSSIPTEPTLSGEPSVPGRFGNPDMFEEASRSVQAFRAMLARIVFDELAQVVFGVAPGGSIHRGLVAAFQELGGNGLVWNIGTRQTRAYESIAAIIREHCATIEASDRAGSSVLENLLKVGPVDAVMLGNLIYMVEMGRYDMAAFFRWLTWFAAMHPEWMDRIAGDRDETQSTAAAFVMEVLRLEQSERLVRRVKRDFVADGFLFPKGASVRFCIWESHKSPEVHETPFQFDPGRFLGERPGPDRYSPFGMDKHQCPFGTYSVQLGATFVSALARRYRVGMAGAGQPVRGLYHWEPAESFSPVLTRRDPVSPGPSLP